MPYLQAILRAFPSIAIKNDLIWLVGTKDSLQLGKGSLKLGKGSLHCIKHLNFASWHKWFTATKEMFSAVGKRFTTLHKRFWWWYAVNAGVVHISLSSLLHHNSNVAYIYLYSCVDMQIFFPLFHNGYYFVVCFNFLANKVEIIHSISQNNVDNGAILVCVSLLVIFYITFSSFCYYNPLNIWSYLL